MLDTSQLIKSPEKTLLAYCMERYTIIAKCWADNGGSMEVSMAEDTRPLPAIKMLLVDDNTDLGKVFKLSLKANKRVSFDIETATTLESALKILREKSFQLILLDLGLPDSQGLSTFEKIAVAHPEIACVILSGTNDQGLSLEASRKELRIML